MGKHKKKSAQGGKKKRSAFLDAQKRGVIPTYRSSLVAQNGSGNKRPQINRRNAG